MAQTIDADGHVEPALVLDWRRAIGGTDGRRVDAAAKRWFDLVAHGSSTRPGAWDPAARLTDMDREHIDIVVLFGSSRGPASVSDGEPGLEPAVAAAFNDWLQSYCSIDRRRLRAAAWISMNDVGAACAEARRACGLGAVGVVINPCTREGALDDPELDPLYATLEELDVPALVHGTGMVGEFLGRRYHTHQRRHVIAFPLSLQMAVTDVVLGGVLERFPRLRAAFLEGGAGWVPWFADRLDEHYEHQPYFAPAITDRPSRLMSRYIAERRLFWSCEPGESGLAGALEALGDGSVVFASDYPHWDCTFPGATDKISCRDDLNATQKQAVLSDNARSLYRF